MQKWTFLCKFCSKNDVFLYNTQCIDASDNIHTCLEGEGVTGVVGVLDGVAMVMDGDEKCHT
jgi:hypothetical protein